jgi:dienelactone hydrolase
LRQSAPRATANEGEPVFHRLAISAALQSPSTPRSETTIMAAPPRSFRLLAALVAVSLALLTLGRPATGQQGEGKRPLTHADYDAWRTIQGQQISDDGRHVAYTLVSGEGESELVVRELASGKEYRYVRAKKGPPTPVKGALPEGGFAGGRAQFSADSKYFVFTIPPERTDPTKPPAEAPKPAVGIMELTGGKVTVLTGVRSFQMSESPGGGLLYHKTPPAAPGGGKKDAGSDDDELQQKKGGAGDKKGTTTPPKQASDLVIHTFDGGGEIVIADVVDYSLTKDGRVVVCSIQGKDSEDSGVYGFAPGGKKAELIKVPIATGKARFSNFTWSEDGQRYLAFFADRAASVKDPPNVALYLWDRDAKPDKSKDGLPPPAVELVTSQVTTGLKDGAVLTDRGGLSFSDDGQRLFVGVAPPAAKEAAKDKDDAAVVELWHWKDDFIQPMQKVRLAQEKSRTYSAVYHVKEKKLVQLADKTLPVVTPSREGKFALGIDDLPYRYLVAYDGSYADYYIVNTADGKRKPLVRKQHFGVSLSPSGRMALFYDGRDWNTVTLADGKVTNITKGLPAKFYMEDFDNPSIPPAYGVAGWSSDEYYVLLYDKYDIWKVSAKGGGHENLTHTEGRSKKVQFRHVKLDPRDKTINLERPQLLRAESLWNHDTAFARLPANAVKGPEVLPLKPVSFGLPTKARNADVLLFTVQSFYFFPDLYVSRLDFNDVARVSNANPQKDTFVWGKSELIHYQNADGVPLAGVLIKPENFDPKKKYPMIVYVYERLSQNVHHFVDPKAGTSINPSYYASNGYLVFMPDITYTVGYPGQSAVKSVLPGIQAVVDELKGAVDESAIGIQGHSWGGYEVAYLITQTGRFKAAAAGAPVTNMTSAYGGIRWGTGLPRQFQYEKTQSRIGGTLWEHPLRFIENSPVFMADRVKTPVLMLHNDQDEAVPWQQGIEFYLALRRLGKEVYLFNYPGEYHGLRKKANQRDYTIRMQQFFDHHLKGAPMPAWMEQGIPYTPPPAGVKGPAAPMGPDED